MALGDNYGLYIPTTEIFNLTDPTQLYWILNKMALAINAKATGIYARTEFVTGKTWYPDPALSSKTPKAPTPRMIFGIVIDFGALPNTATKTVAHGIVFPATNTYTSVQIYGSATDPTGVINIPLPYSSPVLANNIELLVDGTNVSITTGSNRTNFTKASVYFEFIKE
ncbi:MAG TPA: hypothetical protein VMV86_06615 [Methanosarcinales archaeon]|nr:hypothetical protein [Methanosarcinales archaeon]